MVATELPNNWTQGGTEMLLGRQCRQGGNRLQYFRLIHMGDWYGSRNHTSKRRAQAKICETGTMAIRQKSFIAVHCENIDLPLDVGQLMGDPSFNWSSQSVSSHDGGV